MEKTCPFQENFEGICGGLHLIVALSSPKIVGLHPRNMVTVMLEGYTGKLDVSSLRNKTSSTSPSET
jgi:hypothetical protein